MEAKTRILITALLSTALAACGGGGGKGGGGGNNSTPLPTVEPSPSPTVAPSPSPSPSVQPSPSPTPVVSVDISKENAVQLVASVSTVALKSDVPLTTEIAGLLTTLAPEDSVDHSSLLKAVGGTENQNGNGEFQKFGFPSDAVACGSGDVNYKGNMLSASTFSENDTISLDFNECSADASGKTDGAMDYEIRSFTPGSNGDALLGEGSSISFSIDFKNLEISDNNTSVVIDGTANVTISNSAAAHTTSLSADSLTIVVDGVESILTNYTLTQTMNFALGALTISASGSLFSDEIGGSINFETTNPITFNPGVQGEPQPLELEITNDQGEYITTQASRLDQGQTSIYVNGTSFNDWVGENYTWAQLSSYYE